MTKTSPNYQVRPNKTVDRTLFMELLTILNRSFDISKYQYIGLGSFSFEEFKMIHNLFCINDMISLESDENVYKRQQFNRPYECIETIPKTTGDFIADDFQREKPIIIWLDYTQVYSILSQIEEFCTVASRLESKDILRITLNANPQALWKNNSGYSKWEARTKRFEVLQKRLGDYLPPGVSEESLNNKEYPRVLLETLRNALYVYSKSSNKKFLPLLTCVYSDGQQMLTLTGVIYSGEKEKLDIMSSFNSWEFFTGDWEKFNEIEIPALTPIERLLLNRRLPCDAKCLSESIDNIFGPEEIENYIKYYRYYPNFHQVIF